MPSIANTLSLASNPDALYAAALSEINVNPQIKAILSPQAKAIFDTAYGTVEKFAEDQGEALGDMILHQVEDVIGEQTVQEVTGLVSEVADEVSSVIPALGTVVSFVLQAWSAVQNDHAQYVQGRTKEAQDILSRPVIGSGPGNTVTPADIFAPDPNYVPPHSKWSDSLYPYPFMPYSCLGIFLAAITEDSSGDFAAIAAASPSPNIPSGFVPCGKNPDGTLRLVDNRDSDGRDPCGSGFISDNNLHHSKCYLDVPTNGAPVDPVAAAMYIQSGMKSIPPERRRAYQLLRRAMGSHNSDHGMSLYPIYLDMLTDDFASGALSHEKCILLLTTIMQGNGVIALTDPESYSGNAGIAFTREEVEPIVGQIETMIATWAKQRAALKAQAAKESPVIAMLGASKENTLAGILAANIGPAARVVFGLRRVRLDAFELESARARAEARAKAKAQGELLKSAITNNFGGF